MYDTIHLWLLIDEAGSFNLSKTLQALSGITEHIKEDGQVSYSGYLKNIKVNISDQGVSLKGSIAKYFLPDNFHTLTKSDTLETIKGLSDELYLPIEKAKVNRIDFAQNFLMDFKPEAYYSFLGESQYFRRQPQSESLYYFNGLKTKVFYDKIAEGRAQRLKIPDVWNGQNVLRYEVRFTKRLSKQFNQEVTAISLSDEKFYIRIFDKWYAEYEAIDKLHFINFNISSMKSPKDFWKQFNLMTINMIGQETIMQKIEDLRHQNAFSKPEYYSRLKREIRELCKTPEMTESSDLIAELDKKVKASKRYYR